MKPESIKDAERRQRRYAEQGGTNAEVRNAADKALLRERLQEFILQEVQTRHIPMAEVTQKAQHIAPRQNGIKHRVSAVVVREIVKELEDKQLVTRYLDGNIFRIAPSSRNELDKLFAPKPDITGKATTYHMDDFDYSSSAQGSKVTRGYSSYYGNDAAWPSPAGW